MNRIRALTTLLGLVAAAGLSVVVPGTAHAACVAAVESTNTLVRNGTVYVTENPVNGTCNGNNFFQSYFSSAFAGWRASVHIQNNGRWTSHYGGYDTNSYYMTYEDDNTYSLIMLCLDNGTSFWCGWGSIVDGSVGDVNYTFTGVNTGF